MLKIGLPAGAEFALMGIYMAVVYAITKPFGAAAQGGFTIGLRIVQSAFLPVVALGWWAAWRLASSRHLGLASAPP